MGVTGLHETDNEPASYTFKVVTDLREPQTFEILNFYKGKYCRLSACWWRRSNASHLNTIGT